jgi:hypothetical protein
MLSNVADLSSRKMCPSRFVRFVSLRKTDRGSSESKVEVPGRTEEMARVRIEYLVSKFVISPK